jgi:hypothetical protein
VESTEDSGASFSDLLYWLTTLAAVQFGDLADPATGRPAEPNLIAAGNLIELIAMLQEKTAGNLTPDEAKVVDRVLYDLRMRFVEVQKGQKRIILEP